MEFRDKYGNMLPNSWDKTSENPSTFNASYFFSAVHSHERTALAGNVAKFYFDSLRLFASKYHSNQKEWRTMEFDNNPDWSLDEKISTCAFFAYLDNEKWLDKIPLFTKDISHYRPDVFLYVLGSKVKWLRPILYPFVKLKMKVSMKEFYSDEVGQSSGAQLAFIKAMGWGDTRFVLKHRWKAVFSSYYPQLTHPINLLWVASSNNK